MKQPRNLFRCRCRRPWVAKVQQEIERRNLKPGTVTQGKVWHAARCPYPRGRGQCVCRPYEIEVEVVDQERN